MTPRRIVLAGQLTAAALIAVFALTAPAFGSTPKTSTDHSVLHHVKQAKKVLKRGFAHKDWRQHQYGKKKQRKVRHHRDSIIRSAPHRYAIWAYGNAKRTSWKKWSRGQKAKQDPWEAAYGSLSASDKAWAHSTGACEAGNNPATNTGNGYYGLGQFLASTWASAVAGLPPKLRAAAHSLPHTMSAEAQWYVMVHWRNRSSAGQWPVCGT